MTKQEFKNDLVHFHVEKKPGSVVEYVVDAASSLVSAARQKATRSVGKEVVVPGFRKGKAPPELIAKRYPQELDRRWQEEIANASYKECAELAQVPLVRPDANITFKMEKHSKEGAKLVLSFETIPEIPTIDPSECKLKEVKRPEVSKEKVEETIRQARMFFAKWKPIADRPVKEDDYVILDVDIIESDPPERLFTGVRFEVTEKSMAQWMRKLIIGKKAGEIVEGVSEVDDTLSEEEKKEYQPKKIRVTIKQIEKSEMPALDDAFAKQLGVEKVDTLHERIEQILSKQADDHVREQQREQVTDFLLNVPFDLPKSVIEKEAQFRLQQMLEDPQYKQQWDSSSQQDKQGTIDNVMKQAERAVRLFYLCRKISADQKINVSPADLPLPTNDPLEALINPNGQVHDPRAPEVKQAEAFSRVLLEKAEDWVIEHAGKAPKGEKKPAPAKKVAAKKTAAPKEGPPKKKAAKKAAPDKKVAEKKTAAKKTASKKTATKKKAAPKKKSSK